MERTIRVGTLIELLENTAKAKYQEVDGEKVLITSDPKLEYGWREDIEALEDMIFEMLKDMGIGYDKKYTFLYNDFVNKEKK